MGAWVHGCGALRLPRAGFDSASVRLQTVPLEVLEARMRMQQSAPQASQPRPAGLPGFPPRNQPAWGRVCLSLPAVAARTRLKHITTRRSGVAAYVTCVSMSARVSVLRVAPGCRALPTTRWRGQAACRHPRRGRRLRGRRLTCRPWGCRPDPHQVHAHSGADTCQLGYKGPLCLSGVGSRLRC